MTRTKEDELKEHLVAALAGLVASLIGMSISPHPARAIFQVFPRHGVVDGVPFDLLQAAVDAPMGVTIAGSPSNNFIASPVGMRMGAGSTTFIEAGWIRYGTGGAFENCINQYCTYASWLSPSEGSGVTGVIDPDPALRWDPGMRPWFRCFRSLNICNKFTYICQAGRGSWTTITKGIEFPSNFIRIIDGVESMWTGSTMWAHRHQENIFSQGCDSTPTCGCPPNGTSDWCYEEVNPDDGGTVSGCSNGKEWTISVP